jgi:hypothetical protein
MPDKKSTPPTVGPGALCVVGLGLPVSITLSEFLRMHDDGFGCDADEQFYLPLSDVFW